MAVINVLLIPKPPQIGIFTTHTHFRGARIYQRFKCSRIYVKDRSEPYIPSYSDRGLRRPHNGPIRIHPHDFRTV